MNNKITKKKSNINLNNKTYKIKKRIKVNKNFFKLFNNTNFKNNNNNNLKIVKTKNFLEAQKYNNKLKKENSNNILFNNINNINISKPINIKINNSKDNNYKNEQTGGGINILSQYDISEALFTQLQILLPEYFNCLKTFSIYNSSITLLEQLNTGDNDENFVSAYYVCVSRINCYCKNEFLVHPHL